jgi:hypothetical protein
MKTPHTNAAVIAEIISSVPPFIVSQMARAYELVNTPGQEQSILDAMPDFGVRPAEALTLYATIQAALQSIGLAGNLTAPDFEVFSPNEDGTVTYTAPPQPEPDPSE